MGTHAKLNASSAARWMACPGSIRLIDSLPPDQRDKGSVYARQGTAAHELGERCLHHDLEPDHWEGDVIEVEDDEFFVDRDMIDAVQVYLDEVDGRKRGFEDYTCWYEQRVAPFADRDDMFGTADCVIYEPFSTLVVIDYKHGKGVPVEVERNAQAMYYGLGAIQTHDLHDVEEVELVIVQPRAPHTDGAVRTWGLATDELLDWGEGELRPAAERTADPDAPLAAGPHCRFCPAQAICPEIPKRAVELARVDFEDLGDAKPVLPDENDPVQVSRALDLADIMGPWIKAVKALGHEIAMRGTDVPGWKLVRGRSGDRTWTDEDDVRKKLQNKRGIRREDFLETKLISPTQLEKVEAVGKDWVAKYCHKPEGGLSLVHESNKKPAVPPPAIADFAGVDESEDR